MHDTRDPGEANITEYQRSEFDARCKKENDRTRKEKHAAKRNQKNGLHAGSTDKPQQHDKEPRPDKRQRKEQHKDRHEAFISLALGEDIMGAIRDVDIGRRIGLWPQTEQDFALSFWINRPRDIGARAQEPIHI